MKLKINKNIRLGLIIIIVLTTTIITYLIYNELNKRDFEEQTNSVYSYNNKSSIGYAVYLKPNNLYTQNFLEEEKLYISEFVDYIDVNLKYEFIGEKVAEIKGNYNVIAKLKGFIGEGKENASIWEKNYPIIEYKSINTNDGSVLINENVKLNLNDYNTFIKEIKETTKINSQASLSLSMNINLNGMTDKGPFQKSIAPNMVFPLDVTMFEITKNNVIDEPGAVEEIIQVQIPVNKSLIIIYGIVLSVLVIALIVLILFTAQKPDIDPLEKEINKIFRKHGDRLVSLSSDISFKESINVKSIEDLVRVSDEIGKPILYKYSENYKDINKFYVLNDSGVFVFEMKCLNVFKNSDDMKASPSDNTTNTGDSFI